ncbi:GNAT family N-acetyltransferase [Roseomonas sp. OT10]|uniref:bifunctional acetate--CoA ligase family protein/GNAT family N-acetyltransferase n=1 Tax=Roseomonas cutis TaxID=2897332 RepID=UPI001E3BD274|nr:GNAT family N-acetyltransferase [Roseomonas sp. OT10]UFN50938.1 GNAT family N-acetyltransferase [Roseomonas sp. OT10]
MHELPPLPRAARPGFRETALLSPRRVALLADPALPESAILARNLASGGFRGALHAVGQGWDGLDTVPDLASLEQPPDVAVLALPPAAQEQAMRDLAARGCHAAVVPVHAPDLTALTVRTGVRAVGQRSFGLAIPAMGLNATLSHLPLRPGRLALLCQSATLARVILDWAAAEGVGFSLILGIGSNADIGFARALDWISRDTATNAVLLDLRRIKLRRAFISAARAAARTRPVVAVRPGSSSGGAPGTSDAVMEAALRRAGVLRVTGLEALFSAAETLARLRVSGRRRAAEADQVAVVANGLGPALMAADAAVNGGGRLAAIPEAARAMLDLALPEGWHGVNPLVLPPGQGHRLAEAAAMLAALPEVGSVVAVHSPMPEEDGDTAAAAMAALAGQRGAPLLVGWLGQATAGPQRHALATAGLAVFPTPEAAVRGALHLAEDLRNRVVAAELPPREVLELSPDRAAVRALLDRARSESRLTLNEAEALSVLDAYGVPTVARHAVRGPDEAARAAMLLGFPVAMKVLSPDLPAKTEVGGVVLGLRDVKSVRAAGRDLLARMAAMDPPPRVDGLLVERQAGKGTELRLRVGDDAMFGPWIGFGAGGTAADLTADEAVDLPPLNRILADALIARTRLVKRLRGWRDHPAVALGEVSAALVRLSSLVVDFPEIASASINPLLADPAGVLALDADIRLRPAGEAGQLAIAPYPAELGEGWTSPDGRRLVIRPIRPEDAAAHAEAFGQLDPQDIRWRFFSAARALTPDQIYRLTQIDYDREMAFIATEAAEGRLPRTVGVSRLVREGDGRTAEFAVIVGPEWKGTGLARHLMRRVIDWGRSVGVQRITGQVLADNQPMQHFIGKLGFTLRRVEADLFEASLDLTTPEGEAPAGGAPG